MPHLVRAGTLLLAALVVALVVRSILTPDPFVLSSTYRQANVREWSDTAFPVRLVGAGMCGDCHKDIASRWQASLHKTVPCEDCHGATQPHVDHKASLVVDTSRDFCATCHSKNSSRPADFPQVDVSQHWGDTQCVACHNPHDPWAYSPGDVPHDLAGRQDCLSCHGPSRAPNVDQTIALVPADHQAYGNDRCTSCHRSR